MPYKIEMPHVGESVTEAVIGKWLKSPGDHIDKYDPIVEVVTDKVAMEVPAPASGTLTRIIAEEGETVAMGAVIAEMDAEGAVEAEEGAPAAPQAEEGPQPEPAPQAAHVPPKAPAAPVSGSLRVASAGRVGSMITGANVGPTGGAFLDTSLNAGRSEAPQAAQQASGAGAAMAQRLSPVVLRLSQQHGMDPTTLTGTGLGGRVTKQDVMKAVEARSAAPAVAVAPVAKSAPVPVNAEDQAIRPSAVRRMIADHMAKSFREIPHAWSAVEVDVTGLVACRTANRDTFQQQHGVNLTYLPFTLQLVSQSLRANPLLNSTWQDGKIVLKGHVNVGIAVAGKDGLVVPVVHDADSKGVTALAKELAELVEKARSGKLAVGDVQDGTFTLNNTGALGSVWGGAIINHPQAAILTTEAVVKRPVIVSTPEGDAVAVRSMMNICLSFDHRIIDGAEASVFLRDVKRRIEAVKADTALS